jgi:hypothetical protein
MYKSAVSVDRTRDRQIFSLTVSQLSYPGLITVSLLSHMGLLTPDMVIQGLEPWALALLEPRSTN